MNNKKSGIKKFLSYIYLGVTIGILIFIAHSSHGLRGFWHTITRLNKGFFVAAFLSYLLFILCEGYIAYFCLKKQNVKNNFFSTLKTTLIGMYYGCITPSSSGSQPAQIFYFSKQKISVAESTSALSIRFFCYQLTTISGSLISFIVFHDYLKTHVHRVIPFIIFGLLVNVIPVVLLIIIAIKKEILNGLFIFIVKVLYKVRIVKNKEKAINKVNDTVEQYYQKLSLIIANPKLFIYVLLLSIVEVCALMTIVYFVYCAFGFDEYSIFLIVGLQFMLYISVAFAPLPGAAGAQEFGFFEYFRGIFPHHHMYMAIIIWRFFTYYLTIIFGAALVLIDSLINIFVNKNKS